MQSTRLLIVYGTSYGQTAKIAGRMADQLVSLGYRVTLVDANDIPRATSAGDFSGVIVGASVIRGRHQRSVDRFVRANRAALNSMPSAFFSVSGSATNSDPKERANARILLEEFLGKAGWHPTLTQTIGGAIAYSKYNPLLRWVIRSISKRNGAPTDTSRDYELTDWTVVERFVETFAEMAHPTTALIAAVPG